MNKRQQHEPGPSDIPEALRGDGWSEAMQAQEQAPLADDMEGPIDFDDGCDGKPPVADEQDTRAPSQENNKHFTDVGNALRFVKDHGDDARYCHDWKKWLFWDGKRWNMDRTGEAERRAKKTIKKLFDQAAREFNEAAKALKAADPADDATIEKLQARQAAAQRLINFALRSEHVLRIDAMVKLARSEPGIPVLPAQLDSDQFLLNVQNGTLDLRTGTLRPHRRQDLLTKLAPCRFDSRATCPLWLRTIHGIFAGDTAMLDFVQRFFGYALSGSVKEDLVPIFWGDGSNGKTVVLETVRAVMGKDYADAAAPDLLLVKRGERHATELADLHGKRLMIAQETDDGRQVNEGLLKRLTGKDEVKGRRMREDFWSFPPSHKFVLCSNHKPAVKGQDHGIWRRLALVPFDVQFWRADRGETGPEELRAIPDLKEELSVELEGILGWMVEGCMAWQRHGLQTPAKVMAATEEYRRQEDKVAAFIEDCCITGDANYRIKASQLYAKYVAWLKRCNEGEPLGQRQFGEAMTRKKFKRVTNNGTWYLGIAIKTPDPEDSEI
jgi:putative DNA primase/helicase